MLIHTVMWKIKPDAEGQGKSQNCERVRSLLEGLRSRIPEIRSLSVGIQQFDDPGAWDVVLHSTFDDWASLQGYQNHPDHVAVAREITQLRTDRAVVDHEV